MIGLPRRHASAVPGLKRSRWTKFKAAASKRFGWLWQPRLYAGILFGFLLGRALGESSLAPFGIAFYAAVRGAGIAGPDGIPAALAVLAGSATVAPDRFPWIALSILICHALAPVFRVGRNGSTPLHAALLAAIAVAFPAAEIYGRTELVMLLFWVGFTGIVALVFTMGLSDTLSGRLRLLAPGVSPVPAIILLAAAVCGLYGLNLVRGLSLMDVAGGIAVLACAYAGGPAVGAAAGAVLAMTLLFTSFRLGEFTVAANLVAQSMAYVVAGMLAGVFRELRKVGTGLAFVLGLVTYVMVTPMSPDQLTVMALSGAVTVVLFWLTPSSWFGALPAALAAPPRGARTESSPARAVEPAVLTDRITGMSRVFKEISRTLEQVAAVETPERVEVDRPVERVSGRVCTGCSMYHHCWERQFDTTYQVMLDLWNHVEQEGPLSAHSLPEELEEICIKPDQIAAEINYLNETQRANAHFERRLEEGRTVVVDYLRNVSRMMDRFVEEVAH
ncbi:MAG TPA: hypothetical protein VNT01_03085, partial [Symbiobacteriaceae bacterium]|nr:hypothetical protein [Symbiobacteriaceae bacterium]